MNVVSELITGEKPPLQIVLCDAQLQAHTSQPAESQMWDAICDRSKMRGVQNYSCRKL